MVIYVSPAEMNGGILQFSITMLEKTLDIEDCLLFLPDSIDKNEYSGLSEKIILYKKIKTFFSNNEKVKKIAVIITEKRPDTVIFLEDSLLMQQLNNILRESFPTAIVVHDVIQHPYRNINMRKILVEFLRRMWMKRTVSKDNRIILLSENSKDIFNNLYKKRMANTLFMRLGAHVPEVEPQKPTELSEFTKKYFLFFGRIDKYKGIANLCEAYEQLSGDFRNEFHLIIAGKGELSVKEKYFADSDDRIHTIIRFIEDGEMNWLFANCIAVVMPYVEASQSGVLPIAYHFLKPVIVSDQPGLIENIIDGKTGYIAHTIEELGEKLKSITDSNYNRMVENVKVLYNERFLWEENIQHVLGIVEK